jgi:hypothetical protein
MVDLRFEMDFGFSGYQVVDPPLNWKEMRLQLIFDKPELQAQLQSIVFEFVKGTAKSIRSYYAGGLSGGTGILEGIGLRIYAGNNNYIIFDGCIDTANDSFLIDNDIVKAPIKESGRIDWLNDTAQSFTFEYLTASIHAGKSWQITRNDYKQVPYCISTIPNYTQALLLSVTLFLMIKEAVDIICKIESFIARMIGQGLSWVQLIMTIVELILYSIYLYVIITAAARLMQQILDAIVQPKKVKLAMREQDLWTKGCLYLGLAFSSSIYGVNAPVDYGGKYVNATIMPKKITIPKGNLSAEAYFRPPDESVEPDTYGYYEGTFKNFIDDMCTTYHAKVVIKKDPVTGVRTLYFEEKNKFNNTNPFVLPNEGTVGYTYNYPQPFGTNAHEIPAVYSVEFQKDDQDINTYQNYQGVYCLATTKPNTVRNQQNQLLNGYVNVQIPFALARRKTSLLKIEQDMLDVLAGFNGFINRVTTLFDKVNSWVGDNAPGGFSDALDQYATATMIQFFSGGAFTLVGVAAIVFTSDGLISNFPTANYNYNDNRIGWLMLSNDFIGVPKRFIGVQIGSDFLLDPNNQETQISTAVTQSVSGHFSGTWHLGPAGSTGGITKPFSGTVTAGLLIGSGLSIGPISGPVPIATVTGTISGHPGIFTAQVSGSQAGGHFNGNGVINDITTIMLSQTNGWGGAQPLMNEFHSEDLIDKNQWLVYKDKTFAMRMADFNQINYNNIFTTPDGQTGKFESLIWDIHNDKAISVNYRIKHKYTNNYTTTITTDHG